VKIQFSLPSVSLLPVRKDVKCGHWGQIVPSDDPIVQRSGGGRWAMVQTEYFNEFIL